MICKTELTGDAGTGWFYWERRLQCYLPTQAHDYRKILNFSTRRGHYLRIIPTSSKPEFPAIACVTQVIFFLLICYFNLGCNHTLRSQNIKFFFKVILLSTQLILRFTVNQHCLPCNSKVKFFLKFKNSGGGSNCDNKRLK